jgi:hypothetical protein
MSLETPEKIRTLQRKLYCKAKAEPDYRFYLLYDKIHREDILYHAYRLARANAGAPGVDRMTFARIEAEGLDAWLTINETKPSVKDARKERFDFLGYTFGPHCYKGTGGQSLGASPSEKSVKRIKTKISEILVPGNMKPWPEVRDQLNSLLRGWSAYFCHGTRRKAQEAVDHHVRGRVRHFLSRRHKVPGRGIRQFSFKVIYGKLGVRALGDRRVPAQ